MLSLTCLLSLSSLSLSPFILIKSKTGAERLIVDAAVELAERGHDVSWRTQRKREDAI